MEVIRIEISSRTKRRMESFPDINWSEIILESVLRRLEVEEDEIARRRPGRTVENVNRLVSHGGDATKSKRRVQRGNDSKLIALAGMDKGKPRFRRDKRERL